MSSVSLSILRKKADYLFDNTELQPDGCILFKRSINIEGYGELQFRFCGQKIKILAHRAAYMLYHNLQLSKDDVVRHICDNRACIAEAHLLRGTHADNVADRVARERSAKGEKNGRYKHGKYVGGVK